MKNTTKKPSLTKSVKVLNKLEMDKKVFEVLGKKYSLSNISEISAEIINVLKGAIISKYELKIPGFISSKIKHVKARQFVSINTPRNGNAKPVKSQSEPHLRAVLKLSKEIQKMLNGQDSKKASAAKKTPAKVVASKSKPTKK